MDTYDITNVRQMQGLQYDAVNESWDYKYKKESRCAMYLVIPCLKKTESILVMKYLMAMEYTNTNGMLREAEKKILKMQDNPYILIKKQNIMGLFDDTQDYLSGLNYISINPKAFVNYCKKMEVKLPK